MQQMFSQCEPQREAQTRLHYVPNSAPQHPVERNLSGRPENYFNGSVRSKQNRFPPSGSQLSGKQQQQLVMLFGDQYQMSSQPHLPGNSSSNGPFRHMEDNVYNDESIYTEPTLLEHDLSRSTENRQAPMSTSMLSGPPLPPPPPPPMFTGSGLEAAVASSVVVNENSSIFGCNSVNPTDLLSVRDTPTGAAGKSYGLNYSDIVTAHSSESAEPQVQAPQRGNNSQLTITGQDLEITLNNGEITQTVLSSTANGAPAYCGPNGQLNPHLLYYYSAQRIEFLPLCDLLFNIISLAAYFCNVVFDSVTAYTLYLNNQMLWLTVTLALILTSATLSQFLSYIWHVRERKLNRQQSARMQAGDSVASGSNIAMEGHASHATTTSPYLNSPYELRSTFTLALTHLLFGGVLWRYFKLFAPVNLTTVKREVRDLCVLRMVHGFCEAGPMLLIQVYLLWGKSFDSITDLNIISIFLSLFSICWALSSFSKNIRKRQIHKLVLTWLGVIIQFFWRIGTITSRIVALTIYATVYQQWIFIVLFLHWFSMFLWLLSPDINANMTEPNSTTNEKKPNRKERVLQSALVAWVYIFCFINIEDSSPRHKMAAFYCTMFLENVLLLSISIFFDNQPATPWYRSLVLYLVFGSFAFGMFFMWLYYRFFHIRHLKYALDSVDIETNLTNANDRSNYASYQNDPNQNLAENELLNYYTKNQGQNTEAHKLEANGKESSVSRLIVSLGSQFFPNWYNSNNTSKSSAGNRYRTHFNNENIPGVFNCRLNPALKRKKKKPSTIPPPPQMEHVISAQSSNQFVSKSRPNDPNGPHKRCTQLETISEGVVNAVDVQQLPNFAQVPHFRATQYRRNMMHQIQRPSTNTSILTRQLRQPSADTFWRKSALSARSLSISPSAMLKTDNAFRLPAKHPFSSTITTPTSPVNFVPTENFTDKLELSFEPNRATEMRPNKEIIRPKPIVQNSIDLDALDELHQVNSMAGSGSYVNEPNSMQQLGSKQNNLLHYYYHPHSQKYKLRSQTPEVLLIPHSDNNSRVFYDYPSVLSMQQVAQNPDLPGFYKQILGQSNEEDKNEDEEDIFTRQCQRPPVPGREGDEKSEENEKENCNYVEGKRSLLNYGMSRLRLEKILEKKKEEKNEIESYKSKFSHTLSSDLRSSSKGKHSRYLTGPKKKKKYSSKSKLKSNNKRSSLRAISQHSFRSSGSSSTRSSPSSPSMSSSGEDGDIESDINGHERITRLSVLRMDKAAAATAESIAAQNVYDQVPSDLNEEAVSSGADFDTVGSCSKGAVNPGAPPPLSRMVRGPVSQLITSQNGSTFSGQKISNYHLGSEVRDNCSTGRESKRSTVNQQQPPLQRPKPLYHSAKYKRHNTPL